MMMLRPRPRPATRAAPTTRAAKARALAVAPAAEAAAAMEAARAAPAAPVAALQQAHAWFSLLGNALARSGANGAASASLLPLALRADTGAELLELQLAVAERVAQLQQDWWAGWTDWLQEFGQLRRADTLSEHVEQQYNLFEQFGALLKDQAADLLDLQDNVGVDYGYWLARKLQEPAAPG